MILHVGRKTGLAFVASIGALAVAGCAPPDGPDNVRSSAFGASIWIGFESDASGAPLARGTILAEQYAAWGIHFTGGYSIGAQPVDFPDYQGDHGNMLCTARAAFESFPASPWTGQRCFPGQPATDAPLGINLDFPACEVAISLYPYVQSIPGGAGPYTISAWTAAGTFLGGMAENLLPIFPAGAAEMATFAYVPGGGGVAGGPPPHEGANIQIVSVTAAAAGALDNLLIIPCSAGGAAGGLGGSNGGAGGGGGTGIGGNSSTGGTSGSAGFSGGGGSAGASGASATGGRAMTGGESGAGGTAAAGQPGTGARGAGGESAGTGGGPSGAGSGGMTSTTGSGGATPAGGAQGSAGHDGAGAGGGGSPGSGGNLAASGGAGGQAGTSGSSAGGGGTSAAAGHTGAAGGAGPGSGGHPGPGTGGSPGATSGCSYVSITPSADPSIPLWCALGALALSIRRRRHRSGS